MNENEPIVTDPTEARLQERADASRRSWRRLGLRIASVTPAMLLRDFLVIGVIGLLIWLVSVTWIALVPFIIGSLIAYALLPIVNRLDRVMPRFLAILVTLVPVVALAALFFATLIPVAVEQTARLSVELPGRDQLLEMRTQLQAYEATLPPGVQAFVNNALAQGQVQLQAQGAQLTQAAVQTGINAALGLVNALGFLLGFLVVPAWMLTVLSEQQNASRGIKRLLPGWLREDAWAVVRIFDRAFGYFVRGQVVSGILAGILVYGGLTILVHLLGLESRGRYELILGIFAGFMQLIPIIGPFLGALPGVLLAFTLSPQLGVGALVVYIATQMILNNIVGSTVQQRVARLNQNLLILFIVGLSQLGLFWVLLAAPVTGIADDLFRYFYGRLSDPKRPAGVIPGDEAWKNWNPSRTIISNPTQLTPPRVARIVHPTSEPQQES